MTTPASRNWFFYLACCGGFLLLVWLNSHVLTHRYWQPAQKNLRQFLEKHPEARWDYPLILELDALYWTDFAHRMVTEGRWRIRETDRDNAPHGRPVHWASPPAWSIVLLGGVIALFTGSPWDQGVLSAAVWINPILMIAGFLGLSVIIGRRICWVSAGLLLLASQGFFKLYYHYQLAAPDHHGWFNLAYGVHLVFLVLLFIDDKTPRDSRPRDAVISGIAGGVMLWIGATQGAILIALSAAGVMLAQVFWQFSFLERQVAQKPPAPRLWLWWGGAGALTSLAAYLVEYAPDHFALQLEVNHPLYALSYLAAGACLYALSNLLFGGKAVGVHVVLAISSLLVGLLPALLLLIFQDADMHAMLDPVIWRYHRHLSEFDRLFTHERHWPFLWEFGAMILLVVAALVIIFRRFTAQPKLMSGMTAMTLILALLTVGGFWQNRWLPLANMAALLLLVLLFRAGSSSLPTTRRGFPPGLPAIVWTSVLVLGHVVILWQHYPRDAQPQSQLMTAQTIIMLRASQKIHETLPPDADTPVVLLYPNTAEGIGQLGFSNVPLVGAQYWENRAGLRDTLEILGTPDLNRARELIQERGITHLVLTQHPATVYPPQLDWFGKILPPSQRNNTLAYRLAGPAPHPPDGFELILKLPLLEVRHDLFIYKVQ